MIIQYKIEEVIVHTVGVDLIEITIIKKKTISDVTDQP